MLVRPVAAALACRQCQNTILRAVITRPISASFRCLPPYQPRSIAIPSHRFYSLERDPDTSGNKEIETSSQSEISPEPVEPAKSTDDIPWFLEVEPPTHPPSQHAVELPKVPEGAPAVLEPMMKYIFEDMGLDDISLLDLRDLDPPAALGPNLIMLFGTARSERHLHVSSGRFVRWLKRNYKINARADGLIGPGELRTKLRRLRKKAKLMGTNTAIIPGGDNGISTGWVCVNFSSEDGKSGEMESFDESGRFSGFGASLTGTTVVVQCMTESRRHELDLEALWQGILKRNLQATNKIQDGKTMGEKELRQVMASRIQLPTSPSELQWQAMKAASQQKRSYFTSARRLSPSILEDPVVEELEPAVEEDGRPTLDFVQLRKLVTDVQLQGIPLTQDKLYGLLKDILQSPCESPTAHKNIAAERLAVVDQLLKSAEERGMVIWNEEMYVTLTEAICASPDYGPELERTQKSLDYLLASRGWQPNLDHIIRLMNAHASQCNWVQFWDAFRMPSRFRVAREPRHYEVAYWTMAQTKDQKMCIEALRWVYAEMINQEPPIHILGGVYDSLKECISVADPFVEEYLKDGLPPPPYEGKKFYWARMKNREYLHVLREVEALHLAALEPHGPTNDAIES